MIIGLIHSTKVVLPLLEPALAAFGPARTFLHGLDESLIVGLAEGRQASDPFMREGVASLAKRLIARGAERLVLTCSSLSPVVDLIAPELTVPFIKIDRAMIHYAVRTAGKVGILATNPSTEAPTRLIFSQECAAAAAEGLSPPALEFRLERGAFAALASGNPEAHDRAVRVAADELAERCDLVLLAQLSIARIRPSLSSDTAKKVLSSFDFLAQTLLGE